MRIRIINPNTSAAMTASIAVEAQRVARPDTELCVVHPAMGPASIESHYDEAIAALGVLDEIRRGETEGTDGYVIACFGDPGLLAAREAARGPVLGIAEAAMHAASFLATGFSVVTTLERTCIQAEHLAHAYGMTRFCRSIRATGVAVLELEGDHPEPFARVLAECQDSLLHDRSSAIVLGCAGLSPYRQRLEEALSVPVIDGVTVAVGMVETLLHLGLRTSKRGDLALPLPKPYAGCVHAWGWPDAQDTGCPR